jgi:pSer/pThr/pTyr-binding forkhead associated (FHA) protein
MPEFQLVCAPVLHGQSLNQRESFTIGREPGNGIVINDPEISRKHSRMWLQGTTYSIEDLGSTNGTFVNGVRLSAPHSLRPGEVVALGEQISLVFEAVVSDPNATMRPHPSPPRLPCAGVPADIATPSCQARSQPDLASHAWKKRSPP